jgi:hypothetical protein
LFERRSVPPVIAASILFLAAAIATFLVGVFSSGLQMIGVSIGCSVAAAALLLTGVLRDSKRRPAVAPMGAGISQADVATYATPSYSEEPAAEPVYEAVQADADVETSDLFSTQEEEEPAWLPELTPTVESPSIRAARSSARKTAAKPTTKKAAPKKAAARKPAAKKTAAKPAAKKTTAKPAAKKAAPKKAAPKKAAPRKPSPRA